MRPLRLTFAHNHKYFHSSLFFHDFDSCLLKIELRLKENARPKENMYICRWMERTGRGENQCMAVMTSLRSS